MPRLGIRWTIGDVSPWGFRALGLSIRGAHGIFGAEAAYRVIVNGVSPEEAARRAGPVPADVAFEAAGALPPFLARALDAGMAEGVAWKFAPLRVFPALHELSLDNDCILWAAPDALRRWRDEPASALLAEDVRPALGRFGPLVGAVARNSGIRGLPPGFDLGAAFEAALAAAPGPLATELDEQGFQIWALTRALPTHVVPLDDVAICSPFPPHGPGPGRCGVHFVGLNAKRLGWSLDGRPAEELTRAHFERLVPEVAARVDRARRSGSRPEPVNEPGSSGARLAAGPSESATTWP